MSRIESFSWGTYVVGGAAPTAATQVHGRFGWDFAGTEGDESVEFVCQFVITGTTLANLNSICTTMLAALRTKYQKLSIDWGSSNVAVYDPATSGINAGTGLEPRPRVRLLPTSMSTGLTRHFEFRARVDLPPNYNDANLAGNPSAGGRRTSRVNFHYDTERRRVVTIDGTFTQVGATLPRGLTTTANNPTGAIDTYCAARLALIDSGAQWVITRRDEPDSNTQAILNFSRDYSECVNGRRGSQIFIRYTPNGSRIVTIRGTYLRTQTGATSTASSVNYADGTNGARAFAEGTQLPNLTTAQGGPLIVPGQAGSTNCEFVGAEVVPNEQDDRIDYTLVYNEKIFKQSNGASSGLRDPDIINDSVVFLVRKNATDDSPEPAGYIASAASSTLGTGDVNTGGGRTFEHPAVANQGKQPAASTTTPAQKPIDLWISYKATLAKSVSDLETKWRTIIRPYLVGQFAAQLKFTPLEYVSDEATPNPATNEISATIRARAYVGSVVAFKSWDSLDDDMGIRASGAYAGEAHAYLIQQALLKRIRERRISCVYRAGTGFNIRKYVTGNSIPGWLVLHRSFPDEITTVLGIQGLGQVALTSTQMIETLLYCGRAVDGSSGVAGVGGGKDNQQLGAQFAAGPGDPGAGAMAAMAGVSPAGGGGYDLSSPGQSYFGGGSAIDFSGFSFGIQ